MENGNSLASHSLVYRVSVQFNRIIIVESGNIINKPVPIIPRHCTTQMLANFRNGRLSQKFPAGCLVCNQSWISKQKPPF